MKIASPIIYNRVKINRQSDNFQLCALYNYLYVVLSLTPPLFIDGLSFRKYCGDYS